MHRSWFGRALSKQLQARAPVLAALLTAHLGNNFTDSKGQIIRLSALMNGAPNWIGETGSACRLPLGGRVKLDPWEDRVDMIKAAPMAITSVRDKMPFELTPFFPRLTRLTSAAENAIGSAPNVAQK